MVTNVKVKGTKKATKALLKKLRAVGRKELTSKGMLKTVKKEILLPIKKSQSLPSGQKVKQFSTEWALKRRELAKYNKTDKYFNNFKSNLTFTGRFLRSFEISISKGLGSVRRLAGKIGLGTSKSFITYTIAPEGDHKAYAGRARGVRGKVRSNADIGKGQIAQGRDYTIIGKKMKTKLEKIIGSRIRRAFKKSLKV